MSDSTRDELAAEHYETAAAAKTAAAQLLVAQAAAERQIRELERTLRNENDPVEHLHLATLLAGVRVNRARLRERRAALLVQIAALRARGRAIRKFPD